MIDKVFREICRILPEDGWFVSFDYIGPHRNQYTSEAWEETWTVNHGLPEPLRQDLQYPHLPTMLVDDPTEAIHSELITETFHRYFTVEEFTSLGGAIAYPLLTFNRRLLDVTEAAEQARWIEWVLEADERFLHDHPDSSLFAYFTGRPNKAVLQRSDDLAKWQAEEEERERKAKAVGGEYYLRGALATALIDLEKAERATAEAAARLRCPRGRHRRREVGFALRSRRGAACRCRGDGPRGVLEAEMDAVKSSLVYSTSRRLLDAGLTQRIRRNRGVRRFEQRLYTALRVREGLKDAELLQRVAYAVVVRLG